MNEDHSEISLYTYQNCQNQNKIVVTPNAGEAAEKPDHSCVAGWNGKWDNCTEKLLGRVP